jgi:hypothetical protein
MVQGFRV